MSAFKTIGNGKEAFNLTGIRNIMTKDVLRGLSSNLVEQSSRVIHGKNIDYKLMLRTISQSAANSAIGAFIPPAEGIDVHKISNYITTATTSALVGAAIFNQHHSVVKDILSEAAGTLIGETLSEQLLPHFIHDADYPVNTHIPKQKTKESNFVQESSADITYLEAEKKAQGLTDASNDDIFAIKEHDIFQSLSDINFDIDDTHHIVYPKDKLTTPLSTSLYSDIPSTTKPINELSQKFQLDAHHQAENQATSSPEAINHNSEANNYGVWDYTKAVGRGVKNFVYNMYDTGLTVATKLDSIMEGSMSLGVSIAELGAKIGPQSLAKLAWLETKSGLSNSKNNFINATPIEKVEFLSEFTASIFGPGALIKGHQLLAPKVTKAAINATSTLKTEGFAKTLSKGLGFFKESISRPPEPINGYEVLLQGFGGNSNKGSTLNMMQPGLHHIPLQRTEGLGTHSTTEVLLKTGAIPGKEGVILNQRTVPFEHIWQMSEKAGVEFILTKESVGFVLRSGSYNRSPIQRGVRPILQTHPTNELGLNSKLPSPADINVLNLYWARNPIASRPVSQILTGDSLPTKFYATGFEQLTSDFRVLP